MLVNKALPALYNGVSQQPATLRLPSQAQEQVNGYATVVDGLRMRPPTEHLALVTGTNISSAYIHTINRDTTERYIVVVTDGDLKVYDLNGAEKTVTFPYGKAYLDVVTPKTDFRLVSIADYTFVVNRRMKVLMEAVAADQSAQPSDYWSLARINISGLTLSIPAQQVQYGANPSGGSFIGEKQTLQDLPDTASVGDIYKITGTQESGFVPYYVRRGAGVWDETVAPGLRNILDAATMPWALVRKADGTFEFAPFSWAPRKVGDETTNPNPNFVGRTIRDVFFYKNRLGFAVDEGVTLSRAGDFGNYYRLTVLDLLDDGTISVNASETKVALIDHAIPFDSGMMLFADQVQFRLTHGDVLSPTSCSLEVATSYRATRNVRPVPAGNDVYFATDDGNHTALREYYVRDNDVGNDAGNVSAHVPKYVPNGVFKLAASSAHDLVCVLASSQPSRLYTYKYYWTEEGDKAQSAWSYWQFDADCTLLSVEMLDNYIYLVVKRDAGSYLERMPLDSGALAPALPFQIYLDRRAVVSGTYLPGEGKTEFTLPYVVDTDVKDSFRLVRGPSFTGAVGALIAIDPDDYEWPMETVVKVEGDYSAGTCLAGKRYEFLYTFSQQFIQNSQGVPIITGRLQLRTWSLYYLDTAYFKVTVAPHGEDPETEEVLPSKIAEFDGKVLGQADLILGEPQFDTGAYRFQVYGDSRYAKVTITNDTPYGITLQQAEWEGFYTNRSRTL
jgi:hypothetical protein